MYVQVTSGLQMVNIRLGKGLPQACSCSGCLCFCCCQYIQCLQKNDTFHNCMVHLVYLVHVNFC